MQSTTTASHYHHQPNHHQNHHQMNQLGTVYATKRRRRNGKSMKPPPKDGVTKSNPSKRHRERLNAELDTLASLLPFEQNILSKLDRLSILRLAVSYLRTKSYFQFSMLRLNNNEGIQRNDPLMTFDHMHLDGELFLQALNGFLLILTCEGEVFFATHSIESYLGFHQSDIVHQSVYELVHSEDREELQRQLTWNSFLPNELANSTSMTEALHNPEQVGYLERSFTVRFRCLLDNTSGFLRLDIRGRVKLLHGQNRKSEEPPLALFALCTPFGPPSLLEVPQKEVMFKSKHKLDLSLVSMDQRGKMLIGYSDSELAQLGGYDLIHFDDLAYFASAHQELLKTGASGLIAYRLQSKDGNWQWLQTSSRLVYKNSKPDFIICTHRPLMEEEGRDLLGKRTMDFKVSYLDAGLTNSYFSDVQQGTTMDAPSTTTAPSNNTSSSTSSGGGSTKGTQQRRYKTQLRDFLTTVRPSKRTIKSSSASLNHHASVVAPHATPLLSTPHHPTPVHASVPTIPSLAPPHQPPHPHTMDESQYAASLYAAAPQSHIVAHPAAAAAAHSHIQPIIQPNYNYNYNNDYYNYSLDLYNNFRAISYYGNDYYYNNGISSDGAAGGGGGAAAAHHHHHHHAAIQRPTSTTYECYAPNSTSPVVTSGGHPLDPLASSKKLIEPPYEPRSVIMYSGKTGKNSVGVVSPLEDVKPGVMWGSIVKSSLESADHLYAEEHQHLQLGGAAAAQPPQQPLWLYPTLGNSANPANI